MIKSEKLLSATLIGAVVAVIANVLFLFIYEALIGDSVMVPAGPGSEALEAVGAVRVAIFSFVPGLLAGALLWGLNKYSTEPLKIFLGIAAVGLALSMIPDLAIPVSWASAIGLMIMHVIAAAAIVGVLVQQTKA